MEWAQASRATIEEAATEHERVCCAIVEDQAGALDMALGPMSDVYGAGLLSHAQLGGRFLSDAWAAVVGRSSRWDLQPTRNMVAFEGELRTGTSVPNLWRFDEPVEHLFRLLTLPPVSLSNTAKFYADEANGEYYRATVVPDAGGPDWAPTCGRLVPIPIEWAQSFSTTRNRVQHSAVW